MSLRHTIGFILDHPLSRGHGVRNVGRFIGWQIGSRLSLAPDTFVFVNDSRMYIRPGMTGVTGNYYTGLHEFEDMAFILHYLRPDDLFVDVGANVGSYTILAAAAIGARVIAFEPGAEARDWLRRNIALNKTDQHVEVRQEAVGKATGKARFTRGLDTVNHLAPDGASQGDSDEVMLTTLDTVLADRSPTMLKVDVEGFETDVIDGAAETLARPGLKCILMELAGAGTQYGFDEERIRQRLHALGFEACHYDPFTRQLAARDAASRHGNTIFVRDRRAVAERLATAPAFRVRGRAL